MFNKNVFRKKVDIGMNNDLGKNKSLKKNFGIEFQYKPIPVKNLMMKKQNLNPNNTGKEKDFHITRTDQYKAIIQIGNSEKEKVRQPQNKASSSQKFKYNQSYPMKSIDINNKVIIASKDKEPEDGNKNDILLSKKIKRNEGNENLKANQAKKLVGGVKEKALLYKQRPQSNTKIAKRPIIIDAKKEIIDVKKEIDKKEQLIYQNLNEQTPNKSKPLNKSIENGSSSKKANTNMDFHKSINPNNFNKKNEYNNIINVPKQNKKIYSLAINNEKVVGSSINNILKKTNDSHINHPQNQNEENIANFVDKKERIQIGINELHIKESKAKFPLDKETKELKGELDEKYRTYIFQGKKLENEKKKNILNENELNDISSNKKNMELMKKDNYKQINQKDNEIKTTEDLMDKTNKEFESKKNSNIEIQKIKDEYEKIINRNNNEIAELKEKFKKREEEYVNNIKEKNKEIEILNEKLKIINDRYDSQNNKFIQDINKKNNIISEKEDEIKHLKKELEKVILINNNLKNEKEKKNNEEKINIIKKQKELKEKWIKLNEFDKVLKDKVQKINIKEAELNEKKQFLEQTEYLLESEKNKLNLEKQNFEKDFNYINQVKKEIDDLNKQKLNLQNQINMQVQQLDSLKSNNFNNNNFMNNNMGMNNNNYLNNNMNMNFGMNNNFNGMNGNINFNIMNSMNNLMKNNIGNNMNMNFFMNKNINNNINGNIFNNMNNNNNQLNNMNNKNFLINKNTNKSKKANSIKPLDSYKEPTLIGLQNIGATCFMNATLQCLSQTKDLTNYFLDTIRSAEKIRNNNIAMKNRNDLQLSPVYLELVKNLWNKDNVNGYIEPRRFMKTVEDMNPLFKLGQAGDSKDFIIFILEQFHNELKIIKNGNDDDGNINQYDKQNAFNYFIQDFAKQTSIISDIFFGVMETTNICLNCKNNYSSQGKPFPTCYNYQIFNCLIFPLEEVKNYRNTKLMRNNIHMRNNNVVNLDDCFDYNQKTDLFTGDNKNYCNVCKQTWESNYTSLIYSSPNVLVLILNRGKNNIYNIKLNFTETIDITDYVTQKDGQLIYNLYGVITHYGQSGPSAHFLAFCKSPINNKWYRYNDAAVTDVNNLQTDVINFGNPYILFYQKAK